MKRFYFFFARTMVVLIILVAAMFAVRVIQTVQAESRSASGPGGLNLAMAYPASIPLEVRITGTGTNAEIVVSSPGGIDCGTNCKSNFDLASTVKLVAGTSDPNVVFVQWIVDGELSSTSSLLSVTMDKPHVVYAVFNFKDQPKKYLSVSRVGSKTATITSLPAGLINCGLVCAGLFDPGTAIQLTANTGTNEYLEKWVVNNVDYPASPDHSISLTMDQDQNVVAVFVAYPTHTLTINRTGSGKITSQPAGIDCGTTCQYAFIENPPGTPLQVTLTAAPIGSAQFTGWDLGGGVTSIQPEITVAMDTDKTIKATFTGLEGDLALTLTSAKSASMSGFDYTVTITNKGPDTVTGGTLADSSVGDGFNVSWTCTGTGGAACGKASGSGPLADTFTLPKTGSLSYVIHRKWAVNPYTYTVTASVPDGMLENVKSDNSKSVRGYGVALCMVTTQ